MKAIMKKWQQVALLMAMLLPLCANASAVADKVNPAAPTDSVNQVPKSVIDQLVSDEVEMVIVGNDTISIILPEKNYGRYHRGLFAYLFVPKGQFSCGLLASYGSIDTEDMQMLNLISDLSFSAKSYSFKPYLSYFYKHNKELGVRFGISSTDFQLNSLSADIMDDIQFDLRDVLYKTNTTSLSVFHRNYIGLDRGRRFALFNEVALRYDRGSGTFSRLYNDEPKETKSHSNAFRLDFSPGLCVFVHEKVAFNVSFGIFGWYWKRETQVTNGTEEGTYSASGAKFKFNLFNLNMGVSVYL